MFHIVTCTKDMLQKRRITDEAQVNINGEDN